MWVGGNTGAHRGQEHQILLGAELAGGCELELGRKVGKRAGWRELPFPYYICKCAHTSMCTHLFVLLGLILPSSQLHSPELSSVQIVSLAPWASVFCIC